MLQRIAMDTQSQAEAIHPLGEGEFAFPTPGGRVRLSVTNDRTASKDSGYSNKIKKTHVTERWKAFRRPLVRDLRRLKKYKRGWLIFVDQNSLFPSYAKWREFIDELIREANYGYAKKTLNAYAGRADREGSRVFFARRIDSATCLLIARRRFQQEREKYVPQ